MNVTSYDDSYPFWTCTISQRLGRWWRKFDRKSGKASLDACLRFRVNADVDLLVWLGGVGSTIGNFHGNSDDSVRNVGGAVHPPCLLPGFDMSDFLKRLWRVRALVIGTLTIGRHHRDDLDTLWNVIGIVTHPPCPFAGLLMPDAIPSINRSKTASTGAPSRNWRGWFFRIFRCSVVQPRVLLWSLSPNFEFIFSWRHTQEIK